jgi:hypothetical protein
LAACIGRRRLRCQSKSGGDDAVKVILMTLVSQGVPPLARRYQGWLIPPGAKNERRPFMSARTRRREAGRSLLRTAPVWPQPAGRSLQHSWNGHAIKLRVQIDDISKKLVRNQVWAGMESLRGR